jgi:hypothetical protein
LTQQVGESQFFTNNYSDSPDTLQFTFSGFGKISHIICHGRRNKEAFENLGIIFVIPQLDY